MRSEDETGQLIEKYQQVILNQEKKIQKQMQRLEENKELKEACEQLQEQDAEIRILIERIKQQDAEVQSEARQKSEWKQECGYWKMKYHSLVQIYDGKKKEK